MNGPSLRAKSEVRRIAGQPLALVLAILIVWIWIRFSWLVIDSPAVRPPAGGPWLVDRSKSYTLQSSRDDMRPSTLIGADDMAKPAITTFETLADDRASLSGGTTGAGPTKLSRPVALGARRRFDPRSFDDGGWGGRGWSAGYRDATVADHTTSLAGTGSADGLTVSGEYPKPTPASRRWSASAWLLARPGSEPSGSRLIPRYGASQVGAVVEYRLDEHAAPRAYLRASRALVERGEAEIAAGVKLNIDDLPVALHIEHRFAANAAGRDAMALFASGGFVAGDSAQLVLEGYGQAGIVGFRRRTPFADVAVLASRRIVESGPISLSAGAGGWAGAQPGATRIDVGPRLEASFNDGVQGRLSLDWRERVAGRAEPGSGPAMTLSLSF